MVIEGSGGGIFVLPHISSAFCCRGLPPLLLLHSHTTSKQPIRRISIRSSTSSSSSPSSRSQTSQDFKNSRGYRGPKPKRALVVDFVSENDAAVRSLPIIVGGFSLLAILLNRAFSGIALVADATSSQSRADILGIALAVTNILAGLVWLSIQPKNLSPEILYGVECKQLQSGLPDFTASELLWVWDSLLEATCCKSLVIVYGNKCLLQIGVAAESCGDAVPVEVLKLSQGSLYKNAMKVGKQNYLANLSLYPGRVELSFLPSNTQAVILQPIGDMGIAIIGGDTIRGFTKLDQTWISSLADKLDATLSKL